MNFDNFYQRPEFADWHPTFVAGIAQRTDPKRHGDLPNWLATLNALPKATPSEIHLDRDTVTFGHSNDVSREQAAAIYAGLFALKPWRKGPYQVFDTFIDTEWRSDWKWQRIAPHISDLRHRMVLDVGCGTGYHCWRMLGQGADYVLGIDPSMRFVVQHMALQRYAQNPKFDLLPLGIEDMPKDMPIFDSVFSMGVLYHRRTPLNHIKELGNLLKPNGELILETLIIDAAEGGVLTPKDRYAMMRNVWSIMTIDKILSLLTEAGFKHARCVDVSITTIEEQRSTDWMTFHSLREFLDPSDHSKTIEGYPAPKRGTFIAQK